MKRWQIVTLTAVLAVALAASVVAMIYGQAQPQDAAPGGGLQSGAAPGAGSEAASGEAPTVAAPEAEDLTVAAPGGAEYVFTPAQRDVLAAQVMDVVQKYYFGEYPIIPVENEGGAPFTQTWPAGLAFPQSLTREDLSFTTHRFDASTAGVGAVIEQADGFRILVFLYINQNRPKDDPGYWNVENVTFLHPDEGNLAWGFAAVGLTEEEANADPKTGSGTLAAGDWTDEQTRAVQTLVQNIVDGYREGWLPLPPVEDSEYFLNEALPTGVTMPQRLDFTDVPMHKRPGDMWQVQADVPLNDGWVLHVWISQTVLEAEADEVAHVVFVNEAKFEQV